MSCAGPLGVHRHAGVAQHGGEDGAAIDTADLRLAAALRVGHHAEHVAPLVDDAGDVGERAVGVGFGGDFAFGSRITEEDAVIALQLGDGVRVGEVVAVAVGDGDAEDIGLPCQ